MGSGARHRLQELSAALGSDRRREYARAALATVLETPKLETLRAAIVEGRAVGLAAWELDRADAALATLQVRSVADGIEQRQDAIQDLLQLFLELDTTGLGVLSFRELELALSDARLIEAMPKLGLTMRDLANLFSTLDRSMIEDAVEETAGKRVVGRVNIEDLVHACATMNGNSHVVRRRETTRLKAAVTFARAREHVSANAVDVLEVAEGVIKAEERKLDAASSLEAAILHCDVRVRPLRKAWRGRRCSSNDGSCARVPNRLKVAIEEGRAAGLTVEELRGPEGLVAAEERRAAIVGLVEDAVAGGDPVRLRRAIKEARDAGLDAKHLQTAEARLERLDREATARMHIQEALASLDMDVLAASLDEAMAAGLNQLEIAEVEAALTRERRKHSAIRALEAAVLKRSISDLKAVIDEAEELGLETERIDVAHEVLRLEEDKARQQAVARVNLEFITMESDIEHVRSVINVARDAGLAEEQLFGPAEAVLHELERQERAQAAPAALTEDELRRAEIAMIEEVRKKAARECLRQAIQMRGVLNLKAAIQDGVTEGLLPEELAAARDALRLLEQAQAHTGTGAAAVPHSTVKAKVSQEVLRAGLGKEEQTHDDQQVRADSLTAEKTIQEVSEGVAIGDVIRSRLELAIRNQSIEQLRSVIKEGRGGGLTEDELSKAEECLFELESELELTE